MARSARRSVGTVAVGLFVWTGVAAAQSVDPSMVEAVPGPMRAGIAFALVVVVGAGFLWRSPPFVHRSVDASMERPLSSFVYGLFAFGLVGFVGLLIVVQGTQFGVAVRVLTLLGTGMAGLLILVLGSLGYVVLGAKLTDFLGPRRAWNGVVFGAAIGAAAWLVLPALFAAAAWLLGAAVGVGGPMRRWMHADRSVTSEGPV
jgi:hypothetical protein